MTTSSTPEVVADYRESVYNMLRGIGYLSGKPWGWKLYNPIATILRGVILTIHNAPRHSYASIPQAKT